MTPLRRTVLVLSSLLVVAGLIAYLGLDRILKSTVEKQSSASLKLSTTLNSARLSLFGGKVNLNRLRIASPQGFSAPHMLELGDVDLAVSYGQLRSAAPYDPMIYRAFWRVMGMACRPDDLYTDPAIVARLLFGMVNSLTEWLRPRGGQPADELARTLTALAFDGLRPRA